MPLEVSGERGKKKKSPHFGNSFQKYQHFMALVLERGPLCPPIPNYNGCLWQWWLCFWWKTYEVFVQKQREQHFLLISQYTCTIKIFTYTILARCNEKKKKKPRRKNVEVSISKHSHDAWMYLAWSFHFILFYFFKLWGIGLVWTWFFTIIGIVHSWILGHISMAIFITWAILDVGGSQTKQVA